MLSTTVQVPVSFLLDRYWASSTYWLSHFNLSGGQRKMLPIILPNDYLPFIFIRYKDFIIFIIVWYKRRCVFNPDLQLVNR